MAYYRPDGLEDEEEYDYDDFMLNDDYDGDDDDLMVPVVKTSTYNKVNFSGLIFYTRELTVSNASFSQTALKGQVGKNKYRIFCNKRPLPINRPPLFSTFAKFIFRGFTSLSTADTFAIPGFRKMVHFSTSQANIAYEK